VADLIELLDAFEMLGSSPGFEGIYLTRNFEATFEGELVLLEVELVPLERE